ncbi:unnamed protein product [Darwinula stevensoni]|uniref:Citrate transporter-like domain-containing protein n=1 Tax=Darwinula stevensoni TaxID=69355 RepID=A0A7R9A8T6_9CRUS|nr:unnamed protein product [Darwinula stevensoni]CAG0896771.1 unnamed protein product [Darwinula stevensoni]
MPSDIRLNPLNPYPDLPISVLAFQGPFLPSAYANLSHYHLNVSLGVRMRGTVQEDFLTEYYGTLENETTIVKEDQLSISIPPAFAIGLAPDMEVFYSFDRTPLLFCGSKCEAVIVVETDLNAPFPISISATGVSGNIRNGVIYGAIILLVLYILITFEASHLGGFLAQILYKIVYSMWTIRPTLPEIVSWLDMETLALLFGMMIMVAILSESGLFDWIAVLAYQVGIPHPGSKSHFLSHHIAHGRRWYLLTYLFFFTAIISAFLDNVTTVLLLTPVTIRLCEVSDLDPVPVLILMVLFSNIGGSGTAIGDPPNVLIVSDSTVNKKGIDFANFTLHMSLGIVIVFVVVYLFIRIRFRSISSLTHSESPHVADLRGEIAVWEKAARGFSTLSRQELVVRRMLMRKVQHLRKQLDERIATNNRDTLDDRFRETLEELKTKYVIRDKVLLIKSMVVLVIVLILFCLQPVESLHLSLGWVAVLGAVTLLALADKDSNVEHIISRVEWSTLLFFAALFVVMEAMNRLGLLMWLGGLVESWIGSLPPSARLPVAIILILWSSAISSAIIDNIPLTAMMLRIVVESLHLSLGWVAVLGAVTLLALADKDSNVEHIISRVEWSTLLFFAALFVVMEAMNRLGLLMWLGGLVESWIGSLPPSARLPVAIILILWSSAISSAIIDNIPLTAMMLRIVVESLHLSLGWVAVLGAVTLLALADKDSNVEHIISRVEWSTLLFFAALFVVMEAMNRLGLLMWLGGLVESWIGSLPPSARLPVAIILILWTRR